MRKLILIFLLVSLFGFDATSQSKFVDRVANHDTWKLSIGVNAVGSLGERQPFSRLSEFEFNRPLAIGIEGRWTKYFYIEQDFTMNQFDTEIDGGILRKTYDYYSTNTYLKYYFSESLFQNAEWLDMFLGAGLGLFIVDNINTSGNVLVGGTVWIKPRFGIRLQGIGKFAFDAGDKVFDNNHFQYTMQAIFKL